MFVKADCGQVPLCICGINALSLSVSETCRMLLRALLKRKAAAALCNLVSLGFWLKVRCCVFFQAQVSMKRQRCLEQAGSSL